MSVDQIFGFVFAIIMLGLVVALALMPRVKPYKPEPPYPAPTKPVAKTKATGSTNYQYKQPTKARASLREYDRDAKYDTNDSPILTNAVAAAIASGSFSETSRNHSCGDFSGSFSSCDSSSSSSSSSSSFGE